MKQLYLFFALSVFLSFSFISCTGRQAKNTGVRDTENSLSITYATGFSVCYAENYKQVIVYHPWEEGAYYANYYLVENADTEVPSDGVKVLVPLKTLASASVTHFEFLSLLGELHSLTGVCQPQLIYSAWVRQKVNEGYITDLGDSFNINVERTLQLMPDAVMMSGMNQIDASAKRISQAGIPVLYNNEWTEASLLGRAEWIKFISTFYNKEALADSIFGEIVSYYNSIKEKAGKVHRKPSVMSGSNFRGTWYMPAGNSFMGQLFADGGASYFYSGDNSTRSLPLNIETVLVNFSETDFWLNCNYNSMEELLNADPKNKLFRPVQLNQVYNFNKRTLPSGANDFWESATARPDLLLADIIAILHPDILPGYQLFYACKLD